MKDAAVEVEEEMMRRTTLRSVDGSSNQRSHSCDESASEGVQLLSPTLVESFRGKTALVPKRTRKSEGFGWTRSPTHTPSRTRIHTKDHHPSDNQSGHDEAEGRFESARRDENLLQSFDFDGFTLASVRDRQGSAERERLASTARVSSRATSSSSHVPSHFRPERSMPVLGRLDDEDLTLFAPATFDAQYQQFQRRHQQQQGTRTRGGSGLSSSISSSPDVTPQDLRSFTATATGVVSHLTAEAPTPPSGASGRHRAAAVRASGWLEKRKGLVLKRWRAYYCLFKEDDSLCLYASEDTVNGRLEHRFSVLRVLLTDKNDSFHVIAVDSDGAARREEFRASVSIEWQRWFLVFRRFFDEDSLHEALLRKPELLLLDSPARMPPPPLPLSDASPKSNGSGDWCMHHRPSDRSSRASGNQFDNDQLVDSDRGWRLIRAGSQQEHRQSTGGDAESGRASLGALQPGKATASRSSVGSSVGWSRVEPLPVGHASNSSDCSKLKPRRLDSVDGLALQKTSARESLDGPVDELRSTMSLHSVPSGRSALESPTEGSDAPVKTTDIGLVGWTGDLDSGQEEHRERRSASTRSSEPTSDSVFGWSW